jgi:hypothetical protein
MKDLILEEKTGFLSTMPFTIFEPNGTIFYSSDFTENISEGRKLEFNLPLGNYKFDGNFVKLPEPIKTINFPLPPKERHIGSKRYKIEFGNNPNKCTIFYDEGLILFDNSFLQKPLYNRYGVYFHELGHHWYKTESKADLYAVKKMLEYGFNPSQIGRVFLESLSEKSEDRQKQIIYLITTLTKNQG